MMTDRQLVRFATEFRNGILNGRPSRSFCCAICWPLQSLLKIHGVETTCCETWFPQDQHMFLRLADGRILDPTADQFPDSKLPAVYLGPMPDIYEEWMKQAEEDDALRA